MFEVEPEQAFAIQPQTHSSFGTNLREEAIHDTVSSPRLAAN